MKPFPGFLKQPRSKEFERQEKADATRGRFDEGDDLRHDLRAIAMGNAKKGWPVVPLWSRVGDKCGCGNPNRASQGKHQQKSGSKLPGGARK